MPLSLSSPFSRVVQAMRGASAAAGSSHASAGQALVHNDSPAGLQERLGNDWAVQKWESLSAAQQAKIEADHKADFKDIQVLELDNKKRTEHADQAAKKWTILRIVAGGMVVVAPLVYGVIRLVNYCRDQERRNQGDGNRAGGDGEPVARNDAPPPPEAQPVADAPLRQPSAPLPEGPHVARLQEEAARRSPSASR